MPFRFRKSFKVAPGVRLNLSKSGVSTSLGGRGATLNLSKRGAKATLGLPGTGLSYSSTLGRPRTLDDAAIVHPVNPGAGAPSSEEVIILDEVEYFPGGDTAHVPTRTKQGQIYLGVGERASDGMTCLAIQTPGATRRHNIEVSSVRSVTIDGTCHVLDTPPVRWRIRAQELIYLIEGSFSEPWAADYFDPNSPKYYRGEEAAHARKGSTGFWVGVLILVVLAFAGVAMLT